MKFEHAKCLFLVKIGQGLNPLRFEFGFKIDNLGFVFVIGITFFYRTWICVQILETMDSWFEFRKYVDTYYMSCYRITNPFFLLSYTDPFLLRKSWNWSILCSLWTPSFVGTNSRIQFLSLRWFLWIIFYRNDFKFKLKLFSSQRIWILNSNHFFPSIWILDLILFFGGFSPVTVSSLSYQLFFHNFQIFFKVIWDYLSSQSSEKRSDFSGLTYIEIRSIEKKIAWS